MKKPLLCCFLLLAVNAFGQTEALPQGERLSALLAKLGERAQTLQEDLYSLTWTHSFTGQMLTEDGRPKEKQKNSVYEMAVLRQPMANDPTRFFPMLHWIERFKDGKPEKLRKFDTSKLDERSAYRHALWFLLPERQAEHRFAIGGGEKLEERQTIVLTMTPVNYQKPVLTVQNCKFRLSEIKRKGRVWVDAQTYQVLQVQWELVEPFGIKFDFDGCRDDILPGFRPGQEIKYEKDDETIRFAPVTFQNPEETKYLPIEIRWYGMKRGLLHPGWRHQVTQTNFKRFVTDVKIQPPQ